MNSADAIWGTRREVADRLGVPVKMLAEGVSEGMALRYAQFGRLVRYRLDDVVESKAEQFKEGDGNTG